jgi:hypothetical protein
MTQFSLSLHRAGASALFAALLLAACGDSNTSDADDDGGEAPLYAIMYEVFDDVGSNSYLSLFDSLDIEAIDPATSREFAAAAPSCAPTAAGSSWASRPPRS